jgi:hypothetical protein
MWKSFFLAAGIFACICGLELLVVDSVVIAAGEGSPRTLIAPDWAPWGLISAGAVTILHFCTLPKKISLT